MRTTFLYELKKMLLVRKGLVMIVLFFLCGAVLLTGTDVPENQSAEQDKAAYLAYLEQVEGACTGQKSAFLEAEAQALTEAQASLQTLYDSYYNGTLTDAEFDRQAAGLEARLAGRYGFQVLYDQYLYASENPSNRYFLHINGWAGLLAGSGLDFLLVALLLLLTTPVFCYEYNSRMDVLLFTARSGRRILCEKLLLVFLIVTGVCAVYFALRVGFFAVKYGLPHGEYPFQSLPNYGNSAKSLSLWGAFFLLCALKWFGCLFFSSVVLFFSAATRKYAITLFLSTAAVVLPYLALPESVLYALPSPLPFLLGNGFLRGSESGMDFLTGEETVIFREVMPAALAVLWFASILLVGLALFWVLHRHRNRWNKAGTKKRAAALLACCLLAISTGCSVPPPEPGTAYNHSDAEAYEYGGVRYFYDTETQQLLFDSPGGGPATALVRAPLDLLSRQSIRPTLFGAGSSVYYMRERSDGYVDRVGRFASTKQFVSIVQVDTADFQEQIIFEQSLGAARSYLGVEIPVSSPWDFLLECTGFFLNRDSFFFVGKDLHQVDRATGQISVLHIPTTGGNIAFDGTAIYFCGEDSVLVRYDPAAKTSIPLRDVVASEFYLTGQGVLYLNRKDQDKIYFFDWENGHSRLIWEEPAKALSCREGSFYFKSKDTLSLRRADWDGERLVITKAE